MSSTVESKLSFNVRMMSAIKLREKEVLFIHLGSSGIILKTAMGTMAVDVGSLLEKVELKKLQNLRLLLFTSNHISNYSPEATSRIFKETDTDIVGEPSIIKELARKIPAEKLTAAVPGTSYDVGRFKVSAFRGISDESASSYKVNAGDLSIFCGENWWFVTNGNFLVDVAFLPISGSSVSPEYAARMVTGLKAKVVVITNGSEAQKEEFSETISDMEPEMEVIIPELHSLKKLIIRGNQKGA